MTLGYSQTVRNARLDAIETTIGVSAVLKIYSGGIPANTAAARTGTVLATLNLPSDYLLAAAGGVKQMSGTWEDISADASGTAGYFTIFASDGVTAHIQGTITNTGGGGDMTVDNTNVAAGQDFKVTSFAITGGNQ